MSGKGALEKDLSRLLLRVRFFRIYIVDLFLGQWFSILVSLFDAEFVPRISGRDDLSTGVETNGQLKVRRAVVTRRLVSNNSSSGTIELRFIQEPKVTLR